MRICHITSAHPRYDIRIFHKECISLARHGLDVTLIVADGLGNEHNSGVSISDVGKLSGRFNRMLNGPKLVYHRVLELKPEVVHFHDPELMAIAHKLTKQGYKVIYDVHEDLPKQVLGKAWIPALIRPLVAKFAKFQEWRLSRDFAGIVTVTEFIAKRFSQYNKNTVIVHNYPILAEFLQVNADWSRRKDNLCYIGSISETRGLIPLVDSLAQSKLTLDLAGMYSDNAISGKLALSPGYPHLVYHGVLKRDGVAKLLSEVKVGMVTLLPTPSALESLAIKILEYMIAGIPLVTSNFDVWRPIVEGHACGLMVDPSSPSAIAEACRWLINNPAEAQRMGDNGRRAVLAHYTWEAEQKILCSFYDRLTK